MFFNFEWFCAAALQAPVSGAVADLAPACGQTVEADGLLVAPR